MRSVKLPSEALKEDKSIPNAEIVLPMIPFPGLIDAEKAWERATPPDRRRLREKASMREPSVTWNEKMEKSTLPWGVSSAEISMKRNIARCGSSLILRPDSRCRRKESSTDGTRNAILSVIIIESPAAAMSAIIQRGVLESSSVPCISILGSGILLDIYAVRIDAGAESASIRGRKASVPRPAYMEASAIWMIVLTPAPVRETP